MSNKRTSRVRRLLGGSIFSPKGLLVWAVIVGAVFLACHFAGLREYTTIISGTAPTGDISDRVVPALAALYVLVYLASVIVAPILVLAAAIFLGLDLIIPRRDRARSAGG